MPTTNIQCTHTCKEICTALELADTKEKDMILQYDELRKQCTYPDVKVMLNELILHKQKSIQLVEKTKALLKEKFNVLDQVREGFEM